MRSDKAHRSSSRESTRPALSIAGQLCRLGAKRPQAEEQTSGEFPMIGTLDFPLAQMRVASSKQ
jgi:hypothetical protein